MTDPYASPPADGPTVGPHPYLSRHLPPGRPDAVTRLAVCLRVQAAGLAFPLVLLTVGGLIGSLGVSSYDDPLVIVLWFFAVAIVGIPVGLFTVLLHWLGVRLRDGHRRALTPAVVTETTAAFLFGLLAFAGLAIGGVVWLFYFLLLLASCVWWLRSLSINRTAVDAWLRD